MDNLRVSHFFSSFQELGGVGALLQYHHANDVRWGIHSEFIIYFERQTRPIVRVHFLGIDEQDTVRLARERLRKAVVHARPDIAVYHTAWGMPYLADLDQSHRRVLMQHGHVPGLVASLQSRRDWLDGFVCIGESLVPVARKYLPHLDANRVTVLPCPITPPQSSSQHRSLVQRPLILGCCGRIRVEQKRVDRLPLLCSCLETWRRVLAHSEQLGCDSVSKRL